MKKNRHVEDVYNI